MILHGLRMIILFMTKEVVIDTSQLLAYSKKENNTFFR